MRIGRLALAGTLVAGFACAAAAAEPTPEQATFFEKKVLPILSENCYKCHSQEQGKSKGGLTLDTQAALLKAKGDEAAGSQHACGGLGRSAAQCGRAWRRARCAARSRQPSRGTP